MPAMYAAAAARASVCQSVCLSAATAASVRRTGRLYAQIACVVLQIYEWSRVQAAARSRSLQYKVVNEQKILLIVKIYSEAIKIVLIPNV